MRIGYLGPKGTFTHHACEQVIHTLSTENNHYKTVEFMSLDQLFDALDDQSIDAVFSPIENSIEGPVNRVLDALAHHENTYIHDLYEMPIQQSILSFEPSLNLTDITNIVSMPHAIAQCYSFIKKHCPNAELHHAPSTAGSVSMIDALKLPKESSIIIGHKGISSFFPIHLIEENVQDQKHNQTQFCLINKTPITTDTIGTPLPPLGFIAFSTPKDQPGSLLSVLEIFKDASINLTKILSRPEKSEMGSYVFFVEFSLEFATLSISDLMSKIESKSLFLKLIGLYRSGQLHD
jgi:prephenate dehydratase